MKGFDPRTSFGDAISRSYDATPRAATRTPPSRSSRASLPGGPALELAIGTGRIALPSPPPVSASTASTSRPQSWSPASVRSPAARRSPSRLATLAGSPPVEGAYPLIYLADQHVLQPADPGRTGPLLRERRLAHLPDGGVFVIEAFTPAFLFRLCATTSTSTPKAIAVDRVTLDVARHDPVAQTLEESHVHALGRRRPREPDCLPLRLAPRPNST